MGVALAGVGSFLAAVVAGVFIVVGGRGNESRVSQRARRFLTWLRDEFPRAKYPAQFPRAKYIDAGPFKAG